MTLRRIVLGHARRWGLDPAFVAWIGEKNVFLDTLVDRIVPRLPRRGGGDAVSRQGL